MPGLVMTHFRNRRSGYPGFCLYDKIKYGILGIKAILRGFVISCILIVPSAHGQPIEYRCNIDGYPIKIFSKPNIYMIVCSFDGGTDVETLRSWSESVFNEVLECKYQNLMISWCLYLGVENDSYLSDIGLAKFINGKLEKLYAPEIKDKDSAKDAIKNATARDLAEIYVDFKNYTSQP